MTHLDMITQAVQPILDDASIQVVKLLGEIKDTPEDLQRVEGFMRAMSEKA